MTEDWRAICAIAVCLLIAWMIAYLAHRIVLSGLEAARDDKIIGALEAITFVVITGLIIGEELFSKARIIFHPGSPPAEQISLIWNIVAIALTLVGSLAIYIMAHALMKRFGPPNG